jgi:hypothetical protein
MWRFFLEISLKSFEGAFGGSYFREIKSAVTGKTHAHEELEFEDHFAGIDKSLVTSSVPDVKRNKYGVKSGTTLEQWVNAIDDRNLFLFFF